MTNSLFTTRSDLPYFSLRITPTCEQRAAGLNGCSCGKNNDRPCGGCGDGSCCGCILDRVASPVECEEIDERMIVYICSHVLRTGHKCPRGSRRFYEHLPNAARRSRHRAGAHASFQGRCTPDRRCKLRPLSSAHRPCETCSLVSGSALRRGVVCVQLSSWVPVDPIRILSLVKLVGRGELFRLPAKVADALVRVRGSLFES